MTLNALYPFAGQHAVQSAAFAMDFSSELEVGDVAKLRASAASLFGELPMVQDSQRTMIQLQPGVKGKPSAETHEVGGFIMQRGPTAMGQPPIRQLQVHRENIVVVINDYTRWDRFRADCDKYIEPLLSPIEGERAIVSMGLQFNDVFIWKGDPADLDLREVFDSASPFIAPNALTMNGANLWHSHHGFQQEFVDPVQYEELDNINVTRGVVNGQHVIQITCSHKVTFVKPLYKIWSSHRNILTEIRERLHVRNKQALSKLLTQAVQDKIQLNKPSGS